ncbi:MAG TPA: hypothetical protein VIU40_11245 [Geobacteraceae bacterium]
MLAFIKKKIGINPDTEEQCSCCGGGEKEKDASQLACGCGGASPEKPAGTEGK